MRPGRCDHTTAAAAAVIGVEKLVPATWHQPASVGVGAGLQAAPAPSANPCATVAYTPTPGAATSLVGRMFENGAHRPLGVDAATLSTWS